MKQNQFGKLGPPSTDFIWGDFIDESVCDGVIDYFNTQEELIRHEGRVGKTNKDDTDIDLEYKEYHLKLSHPKWKPTELL